MKVFIAKLRDLVGTERHPASMAPRDVLFSTQRRFLEKIFNTDGVRFRHVDVEVPTDGSPIVFRCDISTRENVYRTIGHIVDADWGDFEVKKLLVSSADKDGKAYDWIRASFFVDCNSRCCQYDWFRELQRKEQEKKDKAAQAPTGVQA